MSVDVLVCVLVGGQNPNKLTIILYTHACT